MSEIHINGIRVTLTHLDEVVSNLELWIKGREIHSILYHERNNLSEEQRKLIGDEIGKIRRILGKAKQHFNLSPKVDDAASDFRGHCAVLWENLVGIEGKYLRRYGDPPAELVAYIDPLSRELVRSISRIGDIANRQVRAANVPAAGESIQ